MISERTLRKWRKEALRSNIHFTVHPEDKMLPLGVREINGKILRLTQELLDQHLIKKR